MNFSIIKKLNAIFCAIFLSVLFTITARPVNALSSNYGLKPQYGNNQIAENGQIDIFGKPGQTVSTGIMISNQSSTDSKYKVNFYTAGTSDDGSYIYQNGIRHDSSMKINLKNYVRPVHQIITVRANSVQPVTFNIVIPQQKFTGYLMGGISVAPYKQKAKTSLTGNGTLIKNKYSQGLAVKVRQSRGNIKEPKFRARYVVPTADKTLKSRGVNANIQNYVDGYQADLDVQAIVTRRPDDHKFKVKMKGNPQSVAPNSNYNFYIDWGKNPLQAGNYHLHMKYTTADKTKSWIVDKDFSISNADAAKYNKLSGIKPNYMWLWILIAILALLLVLGLGIYFGRRNQNKQQPMNNNMNNQR
ncbi:hypothetical protein DS831_04975 [Bombilactobacillus bombi]|uniref:Uncharacterized protein n=1 Tax=Bombilactobacillus bombi TaxID=1303590 RepID=A0A417ZII3_9LACO|nr:DUF3324 domain-containing protein [Bombilactobacillus bombi]RHW51378.1 hypothetical protein DS831_04975 [Bombilactobacillus bombi]